ncbi:MAG: LytR/AlgR family response regulator transcription factor, partial [Lutibacter sp.]
MPQPVIKSVIIEDDSRALVALNELIEKNFNQSIEVLGNAATIKNGIELIDKVKPNLVFLDIQLADGEAFEILDGINFKSFEVIFATGSADYREKAMDYFAFYYLKKPIDETQFKVVVNKYLEKKSSFNLENYL